MTSSRILVSCMSGIALALSMDAGAELRSGKEALFGAWEWKQSSGGLLGARETPPPTGWSRVLYLRTDGTYCFWEEDSVSNYLLCEGQYMVHQSSGSVAAREPISLSIELQGWAFDLPSELITFIGPDTIQMYPGGPVPGRKGEWVSVSDALTHTYVRDNSHHEPPRTRSMARRPPRLRTGLPNTYYVDLEPQMWNLRVRAGPFFEWMDGQYPPSVRKGYPYAHNQTPSAAIGDFDGDDSLDVAIHGSTGYAISELLLLLSDHGHPRSLVLLSEPTLLDPPTAPEVNRFQEPHPTFYLKLIPKGRALQDTLGNSILLNADGILVVRPDGWGTPYYYADSKWCTAKSISEQPWDPRDTK